MFIEHSDLDTCVKFHVSGISLTAVIGLTDLGSSRFVCCPGTGWSAEGCGGLPTARC